MSASSEWAARQQQEEMMRARLSSLVIEAKYIRAHLCGCEFGDQRTLDGFDDILKALGIYDSVTEQPKEEMAAFDF